MSLLQIDKKEILVPLSRKKVFEKLVNKNEVMNHFKNYFLVFDNEPVSVEKVREKNCKYVMRIKNIDGCDSISGSLKQSNRIRTEASILSHQGDCL